jgi:MinD-like ATPase involved in chromosome partitioning or flagellar assembly
VVALAKPYIIGVSSQKGGVGKTTISVNLAMAFKLLNYSVLLVDSDTTNPSIGIHLGLEKANIGYRDVLYDKADLANAIVVHGVTGLHVLPGTLISKSFTPPSQANIQRLKNKISRSSYYNLIIFDTAPGFVEEDLSNYYDETLIITTPEMSACTSSLRLAHQYDQMKIKHNLVVNRVKNKRYEISIPEIEEIYEKKVLGEIPEEEIVPISIAEHIPAYLVNPSSGFSKSIKSIARSYVSGSSIRYPESRKWGAFSRLVAFFRRLFKRT